MVENLKSQFQKDVSKKLQKYNEQIQNLNKNEDQPINRHVELFFSFDIVNSSAYKTLNYIGWSQVIIALFDKIRQMVVKKILGAEVWRLLGDEIIFIVQIKEKQNIFTYIDNIFEILNNIAFQLKTGIFFDDLEFAPPEQNLMKMQNIISLKAASWIAIVGEKIKELEQYDNLIERFKLQEGYDIFEFLGNDIDAGFRIKENSLDRRLVISYELAYILSRDTDYLKNLHIITYKHLKGIWQSRFYPIIWYHNDEFCNRTSFEESFYYDEKENSELVKAYFSNKEKPILQKEMHSNVDYALKKILEDQKLDDKFIRIFEIIQESKDDEKLLEPKFLLQLHCVAVCFDKKENRILIMRRAENRGKFPGYWEFGCAKAVLEKSLVDQIQEEYMNDFNIKIKVLCNEEREDTQPVPLAMYEVESEQGKDKGIITLAEIEDNVDIENFNGTKHSNIQWIKETDIEEFKGKTVPDFKNTLKLAFDKIKEVNNG